MLQVSRPTRLSCFRVAPIPCPLYTEVMPTTNDALKYRHGGRPKGAPLLYCTRHQFPSLAPHAASVRSSTMSHPAGLAPYTVCMQMQDTAAGGPNTGFGDSPS